ncbi:MAG: YncE family protein [Balneolaceae bacterium]
MNEQPTITRFSIRQPIFTCFLALLLLAGCSDDLLNDPTGSGDGQVLVLNEGNFSDGNGSLTVYDPDSKESLLRAYQQANSSEFTGIIQSGTLAGGDLFIVKNNPNEIEILDPVTLKSNNVISVGEQEITPVHVVRLNNEKGYLSSLYDGRVYILNLQEGSVEEEWIEVGNNPQQMLIAGNRLFVANSGFGNDNRVSVIDTQTDELLTHITVGTGPSRLELDSNNRIWVLSRGLQAYDGTERDPENDQPGQVDLIDPSGLSHLATIETGGFPTAFALDPLNGTAWVVNDDQVQQINMETLSLDEERTIDESYHGIGFYQERGEFYLAENTSYEQNGRVIVYSLEGAPVDTFATGIAPKDFLFLER